MAKGHSGSKNGCGSHNGTAVVAGLGYAVSRADEAKGALNDFCAATGTATDEADRVQAGYGEYL